MPAARLLLAGTLALASGQALAADIDILAAPEIVAIQKETGFYVRGDASYGFNVTFGGVQTLSGPAGQTTDRLGGIRLDDGFGIGGGVGYKASDWLRFDATLDWWKEDVSARNGSGWSCGFDASCGSRDRGDLEAVELLANAYLDLGTIAGFTPYVGAGLGAVYVDYDDLTGSASCVDGTACGALGNSVALSGEDDWRFAYALSAGVAYDLTETLALDAGYRYLNVENGDAYRFETPAGTTLLAEDDGFDRHTIRAGLRFKFR